MVGGALPGPCASLPLLFRTLTLLDEAYLPVEQTSFLAHAKTRATTACATVVATTSSSGTVHAFIVAPVVCASSTRSTVRPWTRAGWRGRNAPATFAMRA